MRLKNVLIFGAGVLLLLLGLPFLIPTDSYRHGIEQLATEKLHEPVMIGSLHLALLPTPRASIGNLSIGRDKEIQINEVVAVPDVTTLFHQVKVISQLKVGGLVVKKSALDTIKRVIAQADNSSGPASVAVRRVAINAARLEWEGMNLPTVDVDVMLADDGKPQSAKLTTADSKLRLDVLPKGEGYAMTLDAQQWTPPSGPALVFDSLKADLLLLGNKLDISSIAAKLYGGTVDGSAALNWAKDWRASGKFKTAGIQVGDAAKLFSKSVRISGRLSGDGTFSANAKDASALADRLVLDYRFDVKNGVLYGVDLVKAATLLLREGEKGGETQFDELSGTLHTAGKQIDLKSFKVASGLLGATGGVKVSPTRQLDGKIEVELKKGVALVTVPLQVSGTLDDPLVMPTKAALAGALAGTAVLGPGLGTSLGIKAGSAVDKVKGLFGGK